MKPLPRLLTSIVAARLRTAPVVVVVGARQTGKSTLVRDLLPGPKRIYLTLDDLDIREQAEREPDALLASESPVTLDEVQRTPDLLLAVKRAVDADRRPGRFLLTGSANLLLMKGVSETLAGRAQYTTLWPMTRREVAGEGETAACGPWSRLLANDPSEWPGVLEPSTGTAPDWTIVARRGGYPVPALEDDDEAREAWFAGFVRTYLERDLQDLSAVASLVDFRRLMRQAALRTGNLLNQADLARDAGLSQATAHRWLNLLEVSYQILRLPTYAVNRTKRLIKAPKLYCTDAGLAMHLAGLTDPTGAHLETIVLGDLLQWRESCGRRPEVLYWRTAGGAEVDFVIEHDGRLLPIEVKSSRQARPSDARHLRSFLDDYPDAAPAGLLLYAGDRVRWLTDRVLAAPWWTVA